jgi:vanillate O-demethylase monooxygenase subunit
MKVDEAGYFQAFSRYWHPLVLTSEVGDKPRPVTLLGRNLLVWRANGKVVVTGRYCAHRGTDLCTAEAEPDGLRCGYHGWKYGGDGRCVEVPQLPREAAIPEKARIDSYPVAERYGVVWTLLGKGEPLAPLPEWPELETDRAIAPVPPLELKVSAGRVVEIFVDLGHLSWVHRGIFGNPGHTEIAPYDVERIPHGLQFKTTYPALTPPMPDGSQKTDTVRAVYALHLPFYGRLHFRPTYYFEHYIYLLAAPTALDRVRLFYIVNYDKPLKPILDRFVKMEIEIQQQDRAALEALVDPTHPLDPDAEVHSAADKIHVEYRRSMREIVESALRPNAQAAGVPGGSAAS